MFIAIVAATVVWFVLAAILFFNPVVDKIYRTEEFKAGVRQLPKSPKTVGMILLAIIIQVILWAVIFSLIESVLPTEKLIKGIIFGLILCATKLVPRDIDRLLLSTYPKKRMAIELIIGIVCAFAVGLTFAYLL